jgi:hypothetical protein
MTSLTHKQAVDSMLTLFKAAWDTTGYISIYPNVAGDKPLIAEPWARVNITHEDEAAGSLSGATGTQRWTRSGFLSVQVFTPTGEGLSNGHALTKIVQDAFEGQTVDGIWFRNVRVNEIGPDGDYYQINVLIDFTYDEIK